jgi:hypothetical protein
MPLKIASLVCAVLALFLLVYDVGLNLYDMVTYEYFSIAEVLRLVPYWVFDLALVVFFMVFFSRAE